LLKSAFGNQGSEMVVYAFDLLRLNGRDLSPLPPIERRELFERLLSRAKNAGGCSKEIRPVPCGMATSLRWRAVVRDADGPP
jgi:ATP-dependent DNA ligase